MRSYILYSIDNITPICILVTSVRIFIWLHRPIMFCLCPIISHRRFLIIFYYFRSSSTLVPIFNCLSRVYRDAIDQVVSVEDGTPPVGTSPVGTPTSPVGTSSSPETLTDKTIRRRKRSSSVRRHWVTASLADLFNYLQVWWYHFWDSFLFLSTSVGLDWHVL